MSVRLVLLAVAALVSQVFCQQELGPASWQAAGGDQFFGHPAFAMRAFAFPAAVAARAHLEVRLAMVYDLLQFVKEAPDHYRASYEITVAVRDHKGNVVASRIWRNEVVVSTFEETNSRRQTRAEKVAWDVPAGEYKIFLDLLDLDTQTHLRREEQIDLRDFGDGPLQLSTLAFVNYVRPVANRDSVQFDLSATFHPRRELHGLYFEMAGMNGDSASVRYTLRDHSEGVVSSWTERLAATTSAHLVDMERWANAPGRYSIEVELRDRAASRRRKESFMVMSSASASDSLAPALPTKLYEPLRYVARPAEYKQIANAPESQRDSLIAEFWKQRDPVPETPENELLREFNRRLDFAIANFGASRLGRAGWQTDRGRIYIQYGPPTEVQRQTSTTRGGRRYEIWYYKSIDRSFVFRERDGAEDYELVGQQ